MSIRVIYLEGNIYIIVFKLLNKEVKQQQIMMG